MKFTDAVSVAGTRRTSEGYLIAEAKSVRTGIQLYAGDEVGKPDMPVVRVYRAPEEVFAADSLQSFTHAPVTVNHPSEEVTSDNWKSLAVGEVSTAAKQDGQWVYLPLVLKDKDAIAAVEAGKRELSAGYRCNLDWTPGVTADGQQYDARQQNIKINHLALVDRARAGSQARIGDGAAWGASPITEDKGLAPITKSNEGDNMSDALKTVVLGDKAVQVATTDVAVIEAFKADAAAKLSDAEKAHQAALAAKDAELAKAHAERDEAKGKVLDAAALDKLVADRAALIDTARKIAKDVKTDGLSDAEIRKAVVVAKLGDAAVKDKADAYVDARFDILAEDAAKNVDPVKVALQNRDTSHNVNDNGQEAYEKRLSDAWKHKKEA